MSTYKLYQDSELRQRGTNLPVLVEVADEVTSSLPEGEKTTLLIYDESDKPVAVVTNRRIVGTYHKQQWDGRDCAINLGEAEFDATDAVLNLSLADIQALEDDSENTDDLGNKHVDWSGPHFVHLESAVADYFGVDTVKDINEELLEFARKREQPKEQVIEKVTVTVDLNVRTSGADSAEARAELIKDLLENLDYDFTSNTPGAVIDSTEITEF